MADDAPKTKAGEDAQLEDDTDPFQTDEPSTEGQRRGKLRNGELELDLGLITKNCDFALYADDIIIWSSKRDLKEANKNVNKAMKELQHFAEKMKLIINPNKSEVGVFTINNHLKKWTSNIKYDNNQIKFSRTPKYLGVTLDPSLTYGPHINQTVLRAKKRLNILKRISGYEWGADRDTLRQTYLALIRPILEYAQPVWQTASKTNLNKIDQVQSSAARINQNCRD
ncbi:hypothetical protein LAZ67_18001402 [Cordylochernes scorpioides]|uniref:Reverse transcriptase domain-containing protein n=1 Tax=Cordylochernes scorpioides TaxID=51811 RepID=A0ABY6LFS2_9ARAC|nr:hypothetical protein LAZ67_18001402 [Cordylochernes scorpioides]